MSDSLRPKSIDGFVGQTEIIDQLRTVLDSARIRQVMPDHILFSGQPGLGKTTLAKIIAEETDSHLQTIIGGSLEKPADVINALNGIKREQVLFIDEIHGISPEAEETLYSAMEDGEIHIAVGNGSSTDYVTLPLPRFVLVGATTAIGRVSKPLIDRFGLTCQLRPYTDDELTGIVTTNAAKMGLAIEPGVAEFVATRSNGVPRIANRLLRHVRDTATSSGVETIDVDLAAKAMTLFGIDGYGLDSAARNVLTVLVDQFDGSPVGGSLLAKSAGEKIDTLENVIEPLLLKYGLINRTARGRIITDKGRQHVKDYR